MKQFSFILLVLAASSLAQAQQKTAVKKPPFAIANKTATVYTTADHSDLRISNTGTLTFKDLKQPLETQVAVFVDPVTTFQTLVGIGGSLTDATAETFAKLPKEAQAEFLKAYYDRTNGIGFTLGRTNIASCDFSSDMYDYVEVNDAALKTFSVAHDEKFKFPLMKRAIEAAGGKLTLFVSPWSPPAWMKSNNNRLQGGTLKPEFMQSWANHYVKYIKAVESRGMPVWGLSVQNEPMATQRWESCVFTAEAERDFIKNFLGPTLQKQGMASRKLIAWDHNRDLIQQRASVLLGDPQAAKYIWGIGYHWYEFWTGSDMLFNNVKSVHESYPGKQLFFTEGCNEKFNVDSMMQWRLGERYGYSMINDFNSGTAGWTDWNMLLDETGGPNHVGNFCFAPLHADTKTGKLIYTNAYYYMGHFSKFIRPGAKRVATSVNRDKLISTAFINTDGKLAVVVMNRTAEKLPYKLWIGGKAADATSLPHSISTFIIQ
ncbi:glycoside hydrolase family 30 protein [Hufsiella ginkgonis]|uniref:Glycosyl hydrolase n=1 Tax=Hufsiella ginkgonis TaxID=2695274 RepID=A0A7K1Y1G4_9SPHI|nr:glycoside hydrolase family 30 protein [Hufsiella ginkgonis]MXV17090.1 glycosyl hydrolase [Hufsiella ginkgonis]